MSITREELQKILRDSEATIITAATATRHKSSSKLLTQSDLEATFEAVLAIRYPELIPQMQTEYRFSDTRKWRFDAAWPVLAGIEVKVAVETHGIGDSSGGPGRHLRLAGFEADREKMAAAQIAGWIVLEVTPRLIDSGAAFYWLLAALSSRGYKLK